MGCIFLVNGTFCTHPRYSLSTSYCVEVINIGFCTCWDNGNDDRHTIKHNQKKVKIPVSNEEDLVSIEYILGNKNESS